MDQNERSQVAQAVDQATAANATQQPVLLTFEPGDRATLLHHYTGLAMGSLVTPGRLSAHSGFTAAMADEAVRVANEQVMALERFYNLAHMGARGHG